MKRKIIYTLALVLFIHSFVWAQDADSLMNLVLENNRALIVAREASQTAILRAGTGNTPPDPEFELGYLFGDPNQIGNKVNIMVKQEVDFPTVYAHRSKLKEIRCSRAEPPFPVRRSFPTGPGDCFPIRIEPPRIHFQRKPP